MDARFRVWGSGFRGWMCGVSGFELGSKDFGFQVWGLGSPDSRVSDPGDRSYGKPDFRV